MYLALYPTGFIPSVFLLFHIRQVLVYLSLRALRSPFMVLLSKIIIERVAPLFDGEPNNIETIIDFCNFADIETVII